MGLADSRAMQHLHLSAPLEASNPIFLLCARTPLRRLLKAYLFDSLTWRPLGESL